MTSFQHTWFDSCHDSSTGLEHSVVDDLLVVSELSICRERARDVTGVATVFTSHVKQARNQRREVGE